MPVPDAPAGCAPEGRESADTLLVSLRGLRRGKGRPGTCLHAEESAPNGADSLRSGLSRNGPISTPASGLVTGGPAAWELARSRSLMWHRHSYTEDPEGKKRVAVLRALLGARSRVRRLPGSFNSLLRTWSLHPSHSQGNRGLGSCGHPSIHHGSGRGGGDSHADPGLCWARLFHLVLGRDTADGTHECHSR